MPSPQDAVDGAGSGTVETPERCAGAGERAAGEEVYCDGTAMDWDNPVVMSPAGGRRCARQPSVTSR